MEEEDQGGVLEKMKVELGLPSVSLLPRYRPSDPHSVKQVGWPVA